MQKLHTLIASLFVLSCAVIAQPNLNWQSYFGSNQYDSGECCIRTNDGGYIATGSYDIGSYQTSGDLYLIKTDANGNELWSQTYGSELNDCGYSVIQTQDGGYFISGITNEVMYGLSGNLYLLKTDQDGELVWEREYDFGQIDCGYEVLVADDGNYMVCGVANGGFTEYYGDVLLMKITPQGDTLWTRTYDYDHRDCGYGMVKTPDGGFVIAGATKEDLYAVCGEGLLLKVDSEGNLLWSEHLGRGRAFSIAECSQGGYMTCGEVYPMMNRNEEVLITRTDSNGQIIWQDLWGTAYPDRGFDIIEIDNGDFVFACNQRIIQIDADGNTFGVNHIGDGNTPICVHESDTGSYVLTGNGVNLINNSLDLILQQWGGNLGSPVGSFSPSHPPAQMPQGGRFEFDLEITNNSEIERTVDLGVYVWISFASLFELRYRYDIVLEPGESYSLENLQQSLPIQMGTGTFTVEAHIIDSFTGDVIMEDAFPVEVYPAEVEDNGSPEGLHAGATPDNYGIRSSPNPFNPTTSISYQLAADGFVNLAIFNITGRKVATLVEGYKFAGSYKAIFDASELVSGVYFARLTACEYQSTQKLLLVK